MTTNWSKLQQIKRVEELATSLGFELTAGRDTWQRDGGNLIYLVPLDDKLPHYSRGAEIYQGTIEDISIWLDGLKWAHEYDEMIKLSSDKKRAEREQVERNRQLLKTIKTGKLAQGKLGVDGDEAVDDIDSDEEDEYDQIPF
jgi:hypothetical protein